MMLLSEFSRRFVARLRQEVASWESDGTITPEQAQAILARYPEVSADYEAARRRQSLVIGLSILGAVLVGLGIITFFASNWNEIPRSVKLGALVVGVAVSYGAGYLLWQRLGYTAVGIALVLLGCIIFGAGVHLIGQIYHVPVDHPNLTAFWFLGVAPLAYVTRSRPVTALAVILFLAAVGFRLNYWAQFAGDGGPVGYFALYVGLGLGIYAIGRAKEQFKGFEALGGVFRAIGLAVALGALYFLTFEEMHRDSVNTEALNYRYWIIAYAATVVSLVSLAGVVRRESQRIGTLPRTEAFEMIVAAILLTACHLWVHIPTPDGVPFTIAFNVLFALTTLGLLISGYLWESEGRVNLAIFLIAVFIITRYFEYATTLMDLSLVMAGAGVILLGGGFLLERGRRRLLAVIRAGSDQ